MLPRMENEQTDELMDSHQGAPKKTVEPCSIVIFGASGDLTARKLIPAFYHLFKDKQMPPEFRVIGRTAQGWETATYTGAMPVRLASVDLTLSLDDIYRDVGA